MEADGRVASGCGGRGARALLGVALRGFAAGLLAVPLPRGAWLVKWGWNVRAALLMGAAWSGFMGLRLKFAGRTRSPRALLRSFALGLTLIGTVTAVTVVVVPRSIRAEWEANARTMCPGKLGEIGNLLRQERDAGRLEALAGSASLTRLATALSDGEPPPFRCRLDPDAPGEMRREGLYCSYRGPDLETARRFVEGTLSPDAVIACDACGEGGDEPYHNGLMFLLASGEVVFERYDGHDGSRPEPWPVGPKSPDPRFRHMVR